MTQYECIFYLTEGGNSPVSDFLSKLDKISRENFVIKKEYLEEFGHLAREPHSKFLGNELFELRFKGKEGQIRIIYFFLHKKQIVLVHGFIKKTQKTPDKELKTAKERKNNFLMKR